MRTQRSSAETCLPTPLSSLEIRQLALSQIHPASPTPASIHSPTPRRVQPALAFGAPCDIDTHTADEDEIIVYEPIPESRHDHFPPPYRATARSSVLSVPPPSTHGAQRSSTSLRNHEASTPFRPKSSHIVTTSRARTPALRTLSPPPAADVQQTFATGFGEHSNSPERRHFDDRPFPPSRTTSPAATAMASDGGHATNPVQEIFSWPQPPLYAYASHIFDTSGRRSARGWTTPRPVAKGNLHKYVLSLTSQRPGLLAESEKNYNEKGGFQVFTEEDDDVNPLMSTPIHLDPDDAWNTTSSHGSRSTPRIVHTSTPTITRPRAISTTRAHTQSLPAFSSASPILDNFVVSSSTAIANSGGRTSGASTGLDIARLVTWLSDQLVGVFKDPIKYKQFLSYRGEDAQCLLDCLQMLLDSSLLEERLRTIIFVALVRLVKKSELSPQCFTLPDIRVEGKCPITSGHFGYIYKGEGHGRALCIKVVRICGTSDYSRLHKAYFREAAIWGQLSHPNVLPFYGIHHLKDRRLDKIGLVSPWMEMGNVNEYLRHNLNADRPHLVRGVAEGMSYLHENGVVHGDIKGANILVSDSGCACVADFGLSSVRDCHGLKNGDLSSGSDDGGTARFQAPELIDLTDKGEVHRSEASDVYAFSMVCLEIMTGELPFSEVNREYTVIQKVGKGNRPQKPLGEVYYKRGLTNILWKLMEDCWEHDPTRRPTAHQIVERLSKNSFGARKSEGWGSLSPSQFRSIRKHGALGRSQIRSGSDMNQEMIHVLRSSMSLIRF